MQYAVRAVVVEMRHILGQHSLEVAPVDNQHPVEDFSADSADPLFNNRVRRGCSDRGTEDADAFAGEHGVEDAGELAIPIPDQELEGS